MKRLIFSMVLAIVSLASYSQGIMGKWLTESGDAKVEIYEAGCKINGKIIWLQKGPETTDSHNTDEKLRSRKLMGVNILSGLTKKSENGKADASIILRMVRTTNVLSGSMATS